MGNDRRFGRFRRVRRTASYLLIASLLITLMPVQPVRAAGVADQYDESLYSEQDALQGIYPDSDASPQDEGELPGFGQPAARMTVAVADPVMSLLSTAPDDPRYDEQWALSELEAEAAWDIADAVVADSDPQPVVVAVIDTGVDTSHPDLAGRLLPGANTVAGAVYEGNYEDDSATGHGTHIAGIIAAATNNELGVAGAAGTLPIMILPIKALDASVQGSQEGIAAAVNWAADWRGDGTQKVSVINFSLGEYLSSPSQELADAIAYGRSRGIVIIAAAGNHDISNPNGYPFYPAAYPGVIAVGALGEDMQPILDSEQEADMMAPGENILSTLPGEEYGARTGTSFAAPFVSATAAIMELVNPLANPALNPTGDPVLERELLEAAILGQTGESSWNMRRALEQIATDDIAPAWPGGSELTAEAGTNTVLLKWTPATDAYGAVGYGIFQDGSVQLVARTINETEIRITGLQPATAYQFKVEAFDLRLNMVPGGPSIIVTTGAPELPGLVERIAGNSAGTANVFAHPSVSDDGKYVVYESDADGLVSEDSNGHRDIFLYDRTTGVTEMISKAYNPGTLPDGDSYKPVLSGDGNFILYASGASNLVANDDNGQVDLFLYDRGRGVTERIAGQIGVPVTGLGDPNNSDFASSYALSANGRFIAYYAQNGDPNTGGSEIPSEAAWNLYITDRWKQSTEMITAKFSGRGQGAYGAFNRVSISADGRYAAFATDEADLIDEDDNNRWDIFVYDRLTQEIELISATDDGQPGDGNSAYPSISADGRWVVYNSLAGDLIAGGSGTLAKRTYVHDRQTGLTEAIDEEVNSEVLNTPFAPMISADGRFVVYSSSSSDTVPPLNGIMRYDRVTGDSETLSAAPGGEPADGLSGDAFVSPDGRAVVYASTATNIVPQAGDPVGGIFYRELSAAASQDTVAPTWPAASSLTAVKTGSTYAALQWTPAEDDSGTVQYYKIMMDGQLRDIVPGTSNSYLAIGLTPGTSYSFQAEAGDASYHFSNTGPTATAVTSATPDTDSPGQVQTVSFASDLGQIRLTWQDPADADLEGVELYWRKAGAASFRGPIIIPAGIREKTVRGLVNATNYEFKLAAFDPDGNVGSVALESSATPLGVNIERITVSAEGIQANAYSHDANTNGDGRYTVYTSAASNLVAGDTNNREDIFLYDRVAGETRLISRAAGGSLANDDSMTAKISADGRFIVFDSAADNLVADDTNDSRDVFLYDRAVDGGTEFDRAGNTSITRISVSESGQEGDADSMSPVISGDGQVIAFASHATNLLAADTDSHTDVYIYYRDRATDKLELASLSSAGLKGDGESWQPTISHDGNVIAFQSTATNLADVGTHDQDVYVRHVSEGITTLVSADAGTVTLKAFSENATLSGDGQYIAFQNSSGSEAGPWQVYLYDALQAVNPLEAMDTLPPGVTGESELYQGSSTPAISTNGAYLVYMSDITEIAPAQASSYFRVMGIVVLDRANGTVQVLNKSYRNEVGNVQAFNPSVSGNGNWIAFDSGADNLVYGDRGGNNDVFLLSQSTQEDTTPPTWPSGAALTADFVGKTSIVLRWTPAEDDNRVAQYKITYGGEARLIPSGTDTSVAITGLTPDTEYEFTIEAADGVGHWSTDGPSLTASTKSPDDLTSTLTVVQLPDPVNAVRLDWEAPAAGDDVRQYVIYRLTAGDAAGEVIATMDDAAELSYADTTVTYSTTYTYWIMVKNSAGLELAYSAEEGITTQPDTTGPTWPPGALLTADSIGKTAMTLHWPSAVDDSGITQYKIGYGEESRLVSPGTETSATIAKLAPGTTYTFTIEAQDGAGNWSTDGPSLTQSTLPNAPAAELTVEQLTDPINSVRLSWAEPAADDDVKLYIIYRSTGGDDAGEEIGRTNDRNTLRYTDKSVAYDTTYTYWVHVLTAEDDELDYSAQAAFTTRGIQLESVTYEISTNQAGHTGMGSLLFIDMKGDAHQSASVVVRYDSWLDAAGQPVDDPVTLEKEFPIDCLIGLDGCVDSGYYAGNFQLPDGTYKITQVTGKLKDAAGNGTTMAAAPKSGYTRALPIQVTGRANVTLHTSVAGFADGAYVQFFSASLNYKDGGKVQGSTVTLKGLPEAGDYQVTVTSNRNVQLLFENHVAVVGGKDQALAFTLTLPATLTVKVLYPPDGPEGIPAAQKNALHATVTDADGLLLAPLSSTYTYGKEYIFQYNYNFQEGDTFEVKAWADSRFMQSQERTIVLEPGANSAKLTLEKVPTGFVAVNVLGQDGGPATESVRVYAQQDTDNRSALLDAGNTATFEFPAGTVNLQAKSDGNAYAATQSVPRGITVVAGETQQVDLQLSKLVVSEVKANIYTRYAAEDWVKIEDWDWRTAYHYHLTTSAQFEATGTNPLRIRAVPGDQVEICADGYEAGLSMACGAVHWLPDGTGEVELRLEESGIRLQGDVFHSDGTPAKRTALVLYKIDENGQRQQVKYQSSFYNNSNHLNVFVPSIGRYQMELSDGSYFQGAYQSGSNRTMLDFTATSIGQIIDRGNIRLSNVLSFYSSPGNSVVAPDQVGSGSEFAVAVSYYNEYGYYTNGKLMLEVPAGTELVAGSVSLNNQAVVGAAAAGGWVQVDVGNLAEKARGRAVYRLRVTPEARDQQLGISAKMNYTSGAMQLEGVIGQKIVELPHVSLYAPATTPKSEISLYGHAVADSTVKVYDNGLLLGETNASGSGLWYMDVQLPAAAQHAVHRLIAVANNGGDTYTSAEAKVQFTTDNSIVQFTIRQPDGRVFNSDPREGVARYPYVFNPLQPMLFDIEFADPEQVDDVQVHMQGVKIPATLDKGKFHAVLYTDFAGLGPISVTYTLKSGASDVMPPATPEEIQERTAAVQAAMAENGVTVQWVASPPSDDYDAKETLKLSTPGDEGEHDTVELWLKRGASYTPTAKELQEANETGVFVYGLTLNMAMNGDQLVFSGSDYIPEEHLASSDFIASLERALSQSVGVAVSLDSKLPMMRGAAGVGELVKLGFKLVVDNKDSVKTVWDAYNNLSDVAGGFGVLDHYDRLAKLSDLTYQLCNQASGSNYRDQLDRLADKVMNNEIAKWHFMVAAAAAGPETLGVGTAAIYLLQNAVIGKVEEDTDKRIAEMERNILHDLMTKDGCEEDEPDNDCPQGGDCDDPDRKDNDERIEDLDYTPAGTEECQCSNPVWIYDPSGYVYEVDPGNRLQDVTATAMYQDETTAEWIVWDSDWFGQVNPQSTDAEGRYGWDVPAGLWKVAYTKEGYEPAYSEVLPVPPIQTEVNVSIASMLPPHLVAVRALPDGAGVELQFDNYVNMDSLGASALTVAEKDGNGPIEGTIAAAPGTAYPLDAVGASVSYVSKVVRFEASEPLTVGKVYEMTAKGFIASYAGAPMGDDEKREFTAIGDDVIPPAPVTDASVVAGVRQLTLTWQEPGDVDFASVRIYVAEQGTDPLTAQPIEIARGTEWAKVPNLLPGSAYHIVVKAVDESNNESAAVALQATMALALAYAAGADLTPPDGVTGAFVTAAGSATLQTSWVNPADSDLAAVEVSWRRLGAADFGTPVRVAKPAQSYTISGLTANTQYELLFVVVDAAGNASQGVIIAAATTNQGGTGSGGNPPGGNGPGNGGPAGSPGGGTGTTDEPGNSRDTLILEQGGGTFGLFDDRLQFQVAPGGLAGNTTVDAQVLDGTPKLLPQGYTLISPVYAWDLSDEVVQPLTLGIYFDPAIAQGIDRRRLGIYRQDDKQPGQWVYVGGAADLADSIIRTSVTTGGTYAVMLYRHDFSDLERHWSKDIIDILVSRHIVSGVDPAHYEPDRSITRAEMIALLVRLLKKDPDAKASSEAAIFTDVATTAWYYDYVDAAARLGIVHGSAGLFRPNDTITREEMAVMFYYAMGAPTLTTSSDLSAGFEDAGEISSWASQAIAYAVQSDLMHGFGDATLQPRGLANRAQAASMLLQLIERIEASAL